MTADDYDEAAEAPLPEDPEAPYGRKANGEPYKVDAAARARLAAGRALRKGSAGRKRKTTKRTTSTSAASSPARNSTPNTAAPPSPSIAARTAAASDSLNLPLGLLAFASRYWRPLRYDAAVIALNRELVAATLAEFAEDHEWLARVIDKGQGGSKYESAAKLAVAVGAQLAVNHGLMRPNILLGTLHPDRLMAKYEDAQARAMGFDSAEAVRDAIAQEHGYASAAAMREAEAAAQAAQEPQEAAAESWQTIMTTGASDGA